MSDDPLAARSVVPSPDPSTLTTEQLARVAAAERDYVNGQLDVLRERLRGIDSATALLSATVNHGPSEVEKSSASLKERINKDITQLQALHEVKFEAVAQQFEERDKRGERESRDNKVAVDAAFAAQKEAASEQNKSNTLAISKSELATAETINKLEQLVSANIQGLNDKVDDLKVTAGSLRQELVAFAARGLGGADQKTDSYRLIGAVIAALALIAAVAAVLIALKP